MDICAEEMNNNVKNSVSLVGDLDAIVTQVMSRHHSDTVNV